MNIALDFDHTYTADPALWDTFIILSKERGHTVKIVTFRDPDDRHPAMDYLWRTFNIPVVFTAGWGKRQFCNDIGFFVDIWIDDYPDLIVVQDEKKWDDEELKKWRQEQIEVVSNWKSAQPTRC